MSQFAKRNYHKGFTLIELMVVLAIMSVAFALVAPNILKTYDKVKGKAEVVELMDIIKKISYKAFINGRSVEINLTNSTIYYQYNDSKNELNKTFNYLTFPEQNFKISQAGFAEQNELLVFYGETQHSISLQEVNGL
jgi:prepilin-type N-terminal cleavage/methylation domain-containing protein